MKNILLLNLSVLMLLSMFFSTNVTLAQEQKYYYTGKNYGSESEFNPVSLILNGSFDIIQLEDFSRKLGELHLSQGIRNVDKNIFSPFSNISTYGWNQFLKNEVLPFDFRKKQAQWWPNYQLHLIGGGMTFIAVKEWYELHNFPQPWIMSALTIAGYHYINEITENGSYYGTNVDPIADVWIFDLGGCLLFTSKSVRTFFAETLNLRDWSLQPAFALNTGELHNNGQYFSVKWYPFDDIPYGLFYYFGMNGITGISYKADNNETISFGGGLRAKKQSLTGDAINQKTVETVWTAGVFWDRNGSLMSSLFFSGLSDYLYNLNIYPGVINIGALHPGFWIAGDRNGKAAFGISILGLPGVAFSSLNVQ